jgi:aminopeptidase
VHPGLPDEEALARLSEQVLHVCRLDEEDPVAAWKERADFLVATAARVTERRFDAVRFEGPGTKLTVGLLPTTLFMAARFETVDGIVHMPNLPSEEIFGAPDPQRTEGVVRATKPLVIGGSIIKGLEVEFRDGRAVRIDAEEGADVLRGYAARDEGASRLGEVALVDRDGRIGPLNTVFFDTLLDENAASHVALGSAYALPIGDPADLARINESARLGRPNYRPTVTPKSEMPDVRSREGAKLMKQMLTHRLREMGFCEEQKVRLLAQHANVICQVCNVRLGISAQLAEKILVEPIPARQAA